MLEGLKGGKGLPPAQFEKFVAVKDRLLGLAGAASEEKTLVEGYVTAHPDAVPIVKRRLQTLREAGDVNGSVAQCARSRISMKSAPDSNRLDMLTACVALHPDNKDGKTDIPNYEDYLPRPLKAEMRIYRNYLVQTCVEQAGSKQTRCADACACKNQPDKKAKSECKANCRICGKEATQRVRDCKHPGSPARPAHTPKDAAPAEDAPTGPPPTVL